VFAGCICQLFDQILRHAVEEPLHKQRLQIVSFRAEVVADEFVAVQLIRCHAINNLHKQSSLASGTEKLRL